MEIVSEDRKSGLYWLWLSLGILILDQAVKHLVTLNFDLNESINLLGFLNLTLEHNTGAAFSFLSEAGGYATWLFILTAALISSVLCIWLYRLPYKKYWLGVSLSLILGGAVGNLWDRIINGYVIDYIHIHVGTWSWPIFNVADISITTGAIMLIIDIFKQK
jgi:signal peptidase II